MEHEDEAASRQARGRHVRRRPRPWLVVLLGVLVLLLVAGVAVAVKYVHAMNTAMTQVSREPGLLPAGDVPRPAAPTQASPPVTFLLLGTDSRDLKADRGRSDVMIVVQVSGDRKTLSLVSLPRDTWVDIPGRGQAKLNAAYAWGGAPLAVQAVEGLLDVRIDHVAIVNFESFMQVIDTLGGVEVWNKTDSTQSGVHFPVGKLNLNGKQALLYCRERKDLPNGDLDRAKRQRDVMTAIMKKLLSRDVLTNPGTFADVMGQIGPYFTVDDGLTNGEMQRLGTSIATAGLNPAMNSLQLPIASYGTSSDGQSILVLDDAGVAELSAALKNDALADYHAKHKDDPPLKR